MGDFNIDALNDNTLLSELQSYIKIVNAPTTAKGTAVDHIYLKDVSFIKSGVIQELISYHNSTFFVLQKEQSM